MRFLVSRSSYNWSGPPNDKPCDDAFLISVPQRPFLGRPRPDADEWVVDIRDLEHLVQLTKDVGAVIVTTDGCAEGRLPSLEIYDDYREE